MEKLHTLSAICSMAAALTIGAASAAPAPASGLSSSSALADAVEFRAQVTAKAQALLSSEMPGEVSAVAFRDGERFKAGDVLVEYDCALPKARLLRAEAAASAAEGRWRSARELRKLNSISTADYEEARANVGIAAAEAKADSIQTGSARKARAERIQVGRCSIKAPFSGIVGETYVRPHEYVGEGQKLLTLYEVSAFEVEAILPAAALKVLRIGSRLTLTLDDTGAVYPVTVSRIAGSVDPVSQSVKVTGELQLPKREKAAGDAGAAALPLLPGMSGRVAWSPAP